MRGIASSLPYGVIARNLSNASKAPIANANRIIRTEGHRIQQASSDDARKAARKAGCDVVKQWDATLDGHTRETHRLLDGQIREIDEPFELGLGKAMFPGDFGDPSEDINCRCVALTRARAALDEEELATLKERAQYFGLDKTDSFQEYEKKYLQSVELMRRNTAEDGHQIIDKPTYNILTRKFIKSGGVIIRGEDARTHLGNRAYASYLMGSNIAFIRDDATISDVLEEMYHAEQDRKNLFADISLSERILRREIDAQNYLISVSEKYKIPIKEIEITRKNLELYERELNNLFRGEDILE